MNNGRRTADARPVVDVDSSLGGLHISTLDNPYSVAGARSPHRPATGRTHLHFPVEKSVAPGSSLLSSRPYGAARRRDDGGQLHPGMNGPGSRRCGYSAAPVGYVLSQCYLSSRDGWGRRFLGARRRSCPRRPRWRGDRAAHESSERFDLGRPVALPASAWLDRDQLAPSIQYLAEGVELRARVGVV
jgi:hypothetical protein